MAQPTNRVVHDFEMRENGVGTNLNYYQNLSHAFCEYTFAIFQRLSMGLAHSLVVHDFEGRGNWSREDFESLPKFATWRMSMFSLRSNGSRCDAMGQKYKLYKDGT